jgi:hypothetical protein
MAFCVTYTKTTNSNTKEIRLVQVIAKYALSKLSQACGCIDCYINGKGEELRFEMGGIFKGCIGP